MLRAANSLRSGCVYFLARLPSAVLSSAAAALTLFLPLEHHSVRLNLRTVLAIIVAPLGRRILRFSGRDLFLLERDLRRHLLRQ